MNDILSTGTQPGSFSDVWSIWTDEKDDEIFYLKCLGKSNCEKVTKWKLQKKFLILKMNVVLKVKQCTLSDQ